jgi:2-hydroxychromene-2-carboxylate isomerase
VTDTGPFKVEVVGPADSPPPSPAPGQPTFYYDIGDPGCYLVAERIMGELGARDVVPEWEPVHGAQLGITPDPIDADALAAAVTEAGLQPLQLPKTWPPDSELAMLTATFAKGGGRAVAYSLAAFRQVFAGGRDLADEGTVLIAAAACEMHPRAVLKGVAMRSVVASLARAGERARTSGVRSLPAIEMDGEVFEGPGALEQAAAALAAAAQAVR